MNCTTLDHKFYKRDLLLERLSSYYILPSYFLSLLCNAVALWCVAGCPRTRPAVKVLLCAPFSTILLQCLLQMSFKSYLWMWCDDKSILEVFLGILIVTTGFMAIEFWYIFIVAVVRTVAVWSTQRHQLKLRTSVGLVVGVPLCNIATNVALVFFGHLATFPVKYIVWALQYFLPVVLTLACYCSMIFVVRRNKRRLATTQDTAATGQVMDQVTRAMLAVFISNLVLVLPTPIAFFLEIKINDNFKSIIGILLKTHLFVDPLVFVCFNSYHRKRVLQALGSCQQWVCCCPTCTLQNTTDALPLHPLQNVAAGQ